MRSALICLSLLSLAATGCSQSKNRQVFPAGDKATVGPLVYSVTDTEVRQQLGDDPNSIRTPQERFFLIRLAVSNSASDDQSIPAMTLIDDAGKSYSELTDGTHVTDWFGLVRKVAPAQTENGVVVFDAPSKHYHLRLNDALEDKEISIDIPLNFVHEEQKNLEPAPEPQEHEIKIPGR